MIGIVCANTTQIEPITPGLIKLRQVFEKTLYIKYGLYFKNYVKTMK